MYVKVFLHRSTFCMWTVLLTTRCFGQMDLLAWREVLSNTKGKPCHALRSRIGPHTMHFHQVEWHRSHMFLGETGPNSIVLKKLPCWVWPLGERLLNVVEFIWSHILSNIPPRKGASRRGGGVCTKVLLFWENFWGSVQILDFFFL